MENKKKLKFNSKGCSKNSFLRQYSKNRQRYIITYLLQGYPQRMRL